MTTIVYEPKTTTKTRRETFLDAAALMEEHGWTFGCKGMPGGPGHTGSVCILGSIAMAMGLKNGEFDNYVESTRLIYKTFDDDLDKMNKIYSVYDWNDSFPNRLVESSHARKIVVRALRRLADGATWEEAIA